MATTFAVQVDWDNNGSWTDETVYARRVHVWSGFETARDAVAAPGRCTLTLDNTSKRFSPGYTGGALYGDLVPRRPVRVQATSGGSTWTLFRGWIESIKPDAGEYGGLECVIECVDGVALLDRQAISVVHEDSKDVDAAVSAVVAAGYTPPATSYADNGDTLEHYGQTWKPEQTNCLDALRQIAEAVYGRFYVARDGTATYITRDERQDPTVSTALTLADHAVDDLAVVSDVKSIVNDVQVVCYPAEEADTLQEIWKARSVIKIAPGDERVISALFRNAHGERCGAVNVVAPVATTDYRVFEDAEGAGVEYTTDPAFSISTSTEATRMEITLGNSAIGSLYVTLLKVRGEPIVTYDPVTIQAEDSTSQTTYEKRAQVFDLAMQGDLNLARSYAAYILNRYKNPMMVCDSFAVQGQDVVNTVNLFSLELLDKVVISDTQTGASGLAHWVRAVEYDISGSVFTAGFHLERADDRQYWLLGKSGYSELGSTTRLGF